jgi:hypothetical protein
MITIRDVACLQRTVSAPREGGGRWVGAAAVSRMTYHEWAGQGGAARLAVGPRPGACLRSAVGQGASGRERVLTSRRVGSLI